MPAPPSPLPFAGHAADVPQEAPAEPPAGCPFHHGTAGRVTSARATPPSPPGFYCGPGTDGGVKLPGHRTSARDRAAAETVFGWLTQRVDAGRHPCVAARSAFNSTSERFGLYGPPADEATTAGLAADLRRFAQGTGDEEDEDHAPAADASDFATFIAVFDAPGRPDADPDRYARAADPELAFETDLWAQLSALHAVDEADWDPATSPDPTHKDFSFSFAGRSFYIIGMHPRASRPARRFPRPALVFNLHAQFERLRETGKYGKMRDVIRARDIQRTGSMNPMLADFGKRSEAVQYSGRAVGKDWRCPFGHGGG